MKLGIVGLPNVGKSTLFNAITKAGAEAANYPFCTIEPNIGVVVCISRVRIASVLSLSAVGILATVQILALGAPDVALTQLLVESLNIIVIMLILQQLPIR